MKAIGYVRASTDRQAEQGVSLAAQEAKIRAMSTVQGGELFIIDGGESAKNLNRPGLQRLLTSVNGVKVNAVIIAKLDRLTRSVKDLCSLLELSEKRGRRAELGCGIARHGLGCRPPGHHRHGGGESVGASSHRGTDP
jgi:DNA invertase Pin-like site-specific DNA recombinase